MLIWLNVHAKNKIQYKSKERMHWKNTHAPQAEYCNHLNPYAQHVAPFQHKQNKTFHNTYGKDVLLLVRRKVVHFLQGGLIEKVLEIHIMWNNIASSIVSFHYISQLKTLQNNTALKIF